jgi:hypothetical protein
MQRHRVSPAVLTAALSACAAEPELLNSERIEERFGNYGVEILEQSDSFRRSNLYSSENGTRTCRTYAIVNFAEFRATAFADEHEEVIAGQSIGTTFKESGWTIQKETLHIGDVTVENSEALILRLMRLGGPQQLGLHVYRLMLLQDGDASPYATILEVHHPAYLDKAELHQLYENPSVDLLDPTTLGKYLAMIQGD